MRNRIATLFVSTLIYVFCTHIAESCEVSLVIENRSSYTITKAFYRHSEINEWSMNLIKSNIAPNNKSHVTFEGEGHYEIGLIYTAAPNKPLVAVADEICQKSQIILGVDGVKLQ